MLHRLSKIIVIGLMANLALALTLIPLGFFLFTKGFSTLYWNEGRTTLAEQAQQATPADAQDPERFEGQFVHIEGALDADRMTTDVRFLDDGPWLAIIREVKTYAWVEKEHTETRRKLGGSTEIEKSWTYETDWVNEVTPPERMQRPDGHENPPPRFETEVAFGQGARVERTPFVLESALGLPWRPLSLDDPHVRLVNDALEGQRFGDKLYYGVSNPAEPGVGDHLVSFYVVPRDTPVSAIGKLSGGLLQEHQWKDGLPLLFVTEGSRADMVNFLSSIDSMVKWVLRAGGILAIWGGLMLMFSIVFALLDIIPPLGTVARVVLGVLLAPIAITLGLATIGLSQFLHSVPALLIVGVSLLYLLWARWRMHRDGLLN